MEPSVLAAGGTSSVAVGVTVVATLVVVALVVGLVALLSAARQLRRAASALGDQTVDLVDALDDAVARAGREVQRVDDLVGSAESISDAVGSASRLASAAMAGPVIKAVAIGTGAARVGRRFREGPQVTPAGLVADPRRLRGR